MKLMKILHITDIHLDPYYMEGAIVHSHCQMFSPFGKAGKFGSYGCDSPFALVDKALETIKELNPDLILRTGDNARHRSKLKRTKTEILNLNYLIAQRMKEIGIPAIPAIGNNDHKKNSMNYKSGYLKKLFHAWKDFVPYKQKKEFYKHGSFFRTFKEKLFISLNTSFLVKDNIFSEECSELNSPGYKLMEWLQDTLSRKQSPSAFIIGHIPPHKYLKSCRERFAALLSRYRVKASFFGHVNLDHYMLINDKGELFDPVNKFVKSNILNGDLSRIFISPAIQPAYNPALKEFELLDDLVNSRVHYINIMQKDAEFELEYDHIGMYGQGLELNSLVTLYEMLKSDKGVKSSYEKFLYISSNH